MRFRIIALVLVLIILSVVVGCEAKKINNNLEMNAITTENTNESVEDSENVTENVTEPTQGQTNSNASNEDTGLSLDINLLEPNGQMVNLSKYQGKLVFLNFFTTWCSYCMNEMPEFQKVYNEYNDKIEIIIVDVNFDPGEKSVEEVVAWYEDSGYTFPMVIDIDGKETDLFYPYIQGYPTTFVFNEQGQFLGGIPGAMDEALMIQVINQYAAK